MLDYGEANRFEIPGPNRRSWPQNINPFRIFTKEELDEGIDRYITPYPVVTNRPGPVKPVPKKPDETVIKNEDQMPILGLFETKTISSELFNDYIIDTTVT